MGKIDRFEDLIAWQKARELTRAVYAATGQGPFARDSELSSQIQRATVSIMSNIAEGFERFNPREFHQFVSIAKASCAGVRSQLYAALDARHLDEQTFQVLMALGKETAKTIDGLRASVEQRRDSQ